MLATAHLVAFNLALLAALASPGPALLVALRATLTGGPVQGIATGAGLAVMAAGWTGLALLGLEAVFRLFPWAFLAMKLAGAIYLFWLAVSMWRNANAPISVRHRTMGRHAFVRGLLVNLANPKSVIFASAVLLVIFPRDLTGFDKLLIVGNHFVVELLVYSAFALLLSTPPARNGYLRAKPALDRVASVVMGALGLRMMLER